MNKLLRISKKEYYNKYFFENISDSKKVWKRIKQIVHFKSQTNIKNIKLKIGEKETANPAEVAKAFNNYFSNVGNNLASLLPHVTKNSMDYLLNPVDNSLKLYFSYNK